MCHGGSYTLENYLPELFTLAKQLAQERKDINFQILSIEFPYGKEALTDISLKQHYLNNVKQVIKQCDYMIDWSKTIVIGRCLGAYAACLIVNEFPEVKHCILLSMITPMRTLFNEILGNRLSRWLIPNENMFRLKQKDVPNMCKSSKLSVICIHGCRDHLYSMKNVTDWLNEMNFTNMKLMAIHTLGHDLLDVNNTLPLILGSITNKAKKDSFFETEHVMDLPVKFSLGYPVTQSPNKKEL